MRAVVLAGQGSPDVLVPGDVEEPAVGSGDVQVTVAGAAVNPVDLKTRSGFLSDIVLTFPAVLGWDVAGIVTAVGAAVDRFAVGDRVVGMIAQPVHRYGTYAERVVADQSLFAPAPRSLPLDEAAAIPLAALTAWQTTAALHVAEGTPVLVTGAAGAVGRIVTQLLIRRGHEVDALARASDTDELRDLGAHAVFDRPQALPARRYAGVVDTAGVAAAVRAVRDNGRFVSIDDNEQPDPERGVTPAKNYVDENGVQLAEIVARIDAGLLSVPVAHKFPLDDAARAHGVLAAGGTRGRVLLIP